MDIVKLFETQVALWNAEKKCGCCYLFGAPLTDSSLNKTQIEDCCLNVQITNLTRRDNRSYDPTTSLLTDFTRDYTFTLHILFPDDLGINTYNEILGHPITESKWEKILQPIDACFCPEDVIEFCRILKKRLQILSFSSQVRINWL